jgi:hypothetical protein
VDNSDRDRDETLFCSDWQVASGGLRAGGGREAQAQVGHGMAVGSYEQLNESGVGRKERRRLAELASGRHRR